MVPADIQMTAIQTDAVDGQVLEAPDSDAVRLESRGNVFPNTPNAGETQVDFLDADFKIVELLGIEIGSRIKIEYTYLATFSAEANVIDIRNNNLTIEIDEVVGVSNAPNVVVTITNLDTELTVGPFNLIGDNIEDVWFHFQTQPSNGSKTTIDVDAEVELLDENGDPTGIVTAETFEMVSFGSGSNHFTRKITGLTSGKYRAKTIRTSNQETAVLLLEGIVSFQPQVDNNYGDVTIITTERAGTINPTSSGGGRIHLPKAQRLLPSFNRSTGLRDGPETPVLDFADCALDIMLKAGYEYDRIDTDELYAINDRLSQSMRSFSFVFDDADVPAGDRIQTACNVARVAAFKDGQVWTFTREESKSIRTAIFNRRNTIPSSATQQFNYQRPTDFDGVTVQYVDLDDNVNAFEYRAILGNSIIEQSFPTQRALEIKLAGCYNQEQAANRADLEIRKIVYQRNGVSDDIYLDGFNVALNDRVGWADINDGDTFDGEILGAEIDASGSQPLYIYRTSEKFTPENGKLYYATSTDENGQSLTSETAVQCFAVDNNAFAFYTTTQISGLAPDEVNQGGSYYIIAESGEVTDYIVTARKPKNSSVTTIEMLEYNESIFEKD